jgi:hypothetical protein
MCGRFTDVGAGIRDVKLKRYPAVCGRETPFVFNENVRLPALARSFAAADRFLLGNCACLFRKTMTNGIIIEREYRISQGDIPYILTTQLRFINPTAKAYDLEHVFVGLGSFPATPGHVLGDCLNFDYYNGHKARFIGANDLRAKKGFYGLGSEPAKTQIPAMIGLSGDRLKISFCGSIYIQGPRLRLRRDAEWGRGDGGWQRRRQH